MWRQIVELKYLKILAEQFPNIQMASNKIVSLEALASLPKGTEHFLSDLHGEEGAFNHIMNNCSGVIKEKIELVHSRSMTSCDRATLATLIYYPRLKLKEIAETMPDMKEWYKVTIYQLIEVCRVIASKYSREHLRKAFTKEFAWTFDELIYADHSGMNREPYFEKIIDTVIELNQGESFISNISIAIKFLAVDTLHIVGDIYDRGAHPDKIIELLMNHHSCDIQWGNHDIVWMGACVGSLPCIANVLNLSLTYNNTEVLEMSYGISLRALSHFAKENYKDVSRFIPKGHSENENELELAQMRKAIAVIMFKLEGAVIMRNPCFEMNERLLLQKIDYEKGTITIEGETYDLLDSDFPTIDKNDPYKLTDGENEVVTKLQKSFRQSEKLYSHVRFLYERGSIYLVTNNNLLYHGCIPMERSGDFMQFHTPENEVVSGKTFMDYCDKTARRAFYGGCGIEEQQYAKDFMWYLWCGAKSPLFGRGKMTTFERFFVNSSKLIEEQKNAYYLMYNNDFTFEKIAREFGLCKETSHIINGHVPVKSIEGESPIKAGGRLIVIDGGFCKAYHETTGIAGYTLIYNSYGMRLSAHTAFVSKEEAVKNNADIYGTVNVFESAKERITVANTDKGKIIAEQINDLKKLNKAYLKGDIKQRS